MPTHLHDQHRVDQSIHAVPDTRQGHGDGHDDMDLDHTQGVPSTAAIAGHPIHPALVALPIAFLVGAFGADVGFWWTRDPFWARVALWLTGTGAGLGVLAAVPGLIDFMTIERARVHRIGWVHALGNGGVLVVAVVSWLLRLGDPVAIVLPWGLVLSTITAGILVVTGWTGGELAYRHMIGVTGHGPHTHDHGTKEESSMQDHTQHQSMAGSAAKADGRADSPASGSGGHMTMAMAAGGGHDMTNMQSDVTRPQLTAMTLLSLLPLVAAILWSVNYTDLRIGAHEVAGAVMPPGMIMARDTPAEAMRDMAAVDLNEVSYTAPTAARGDQPLEPRIENGVKVFDLDVSVIEWNILPDERVAAYAFNLQVPGPRIRVTQGDRVRINVTNNLPESTTVHWHGLILPNEMDGPAHITQEPIEPGGTYTYEFTAQQFGTYFYHSHDHADRQQALGMYGALIIDPQDEAIDAAYDYNQDVVIQLQEWTFKEGYTFPAMPMEGALPNFFTINGKAYPETETINLKVGEKLRVRFIGTSGAFIHPMHIHGGPFRIVQTDGELVPEGAQVLKDTVNVGPGERYDVIWEAREPGKWLLHCHINHHTTNNNVEQEGGGGLTMVINVRP
jgi:FtsP/CotA-like multicopper oxidase with cupredoxin domain/uncharacterized membrane protein